MLNVLLWYVLVNRLSQVNISMQSYLGKYQYVYAGLCTEMNYKIKFPFMWSMGFTCEMFSGRFQMRFSSFFSRCVCEPEKMTWGRENTSSWEYTPKTAIHTNKQPNLHRKNETPLLCINSSVESFNEEFFTKSKLHDHFVTFNFFQKEVLKLQNQI